VSLLEVPNMGFWAGWCTRQSDALTPRVLLQASIELAPTYAALILADDGIEITVRHENSRQ
jgi:hypothetical protein